MAFAAGGALAGLAQAGSLWRTAAQRDEGWGFALRFALVGAVLLGASLAGEIIAAAVGWGLGFAVGVAVGVAVVSRRNSP